MKVLNKKGFTLIELLAVIIVLAIVTLIAVQAVLPQIEKARKNAFVSEANNAIEAAKEWYANQVLEGTSPATCVNIETLINGGYYDVNDKDKYDGHIEITTSGGIVSGYKIMMTNGSYKTKALHTGKITTAEAKDASTVIPGNTATKC